MIRPVREVLRGGWYFPLPFAVLIAALFVWNRSPAEAALYAAGTLLAANMAFSTKANAPVSPACCTR